MKKINLLITLILVCIIISSSIFCVTFSTLTQSAVLCLCLLLFGLTSFTFFKSESPTLNTNYLYIFIGCLSYYMVRSFCSPVPSLGLADLFLMCGGSVVYYAVALNSNKEKLFAGVLIAVILAMIFNLLMWIPAINEIRDGLLPFAKGTNVSGMFNHRNFYSSFMVCCVCFTLCSALWGGYTTWLKTILYVVSILSSLSILNALARGGLLALVVVWFVVFILLIYSAERVKKGRHALLLLLVIVTAISAKIGFSYIVDKRVEATGYTAFNLTNAKGRSAYFAIAVDQIGDAPFIGSGSRSIEYKSYSNWHPRLAANNNFKFVHNEFLQSITDYGLIGFLLLIIFAGYHLFNGFVRFFSDPHSNIQSKTKLYSAVCLTSIIAISVNSAVSFPLHCFPVIILLSIAMALNIPSTKIKRVKNKGDYLGLVPHFIMLSLIVISSISIIKEFRAAVPFWKEGIVVDDANWSLDILEERNWEPALAASVELNNNFDRLNKLGVIMMGASLKDISSQRLERAIAYLKRSKILNPLDPISRLNLARCYSTKKDYAKAFDEYKSVEPMVYKRESFFNYYIYYANLSIIWAQEEHLKGDRGKALELIEIAAKLRQKRVKLIDDKLKGEYLQTYGEILLLKYTLLIQEGRITEAYEVFDAYIELGSQMYSYKVKADALQRHGDMLLEHSKYVWLKRDPERAISVVNKAKSAYMKAKHGLKGNVNREWLTSMQAVDYMIKILKGAGYNRKRQ